MAVAGKKAKQIVQDAESSVYLIDDAPVGTLDDLLDIKDEDFAGVSVADLEQYEDTIGLIEYPHIKVNTRKLVDALKLSMVVSQGSGRDLIPRSVGFEVKGGELQVYLSDVDSFIQKSVDLINDDNILTDFFVINFTILSKLIKGCGALTAIYKKDNKYWLKVIGSDMELETTALEKAQLVLPITPSYKKVGDIGNKELYNIIKDLYILASSSVTPAQRRIFFKGDTATAMFLFCVATYKGMKTFPTMDLSTKDMRLLYSLSLGCEDIELYVHQKDNRFVISGSNFSYSFLVTSNTVPSQLVDSMGSILQETPIYVDYLQLSKIVAISTEYMYSISKLDFNYNDMGYIETILRAKKLSDNVFKINGAPNPNLKPLDKHVPIQSNLLKSLLKVFSMDSTIGLIIHPHGLGLVSDRYKAVLYSENM